MRSPEPLLSQIQHPRDLDDLTFEQLDQVAQEIRDFIIESVSVTGGHLGSNLGAVELTLALHRVLQTPEDVLLWDTGHQTYTHKILTGRQKDFANLRQEGGLSGYPSRAESSSDWIENSHASTSLSYAHGIAIALQADPLNSRHVAAVIGDGALTGGMAFEGLNNLGHSGARCLIVLNDNGRSYSPTVSKLAESVHQLRANPKYLAARERVEQGLKGIPAVGKLASLGAKSVRAALREAVGPPTFFEALGVRYVGPIDGHDIESMEQAFRSALSYDGPIVVHVLTEKGRGYQPALDDEEKHLHDVSVFDPAKGPSRVERSGDFAEAFSDALVQIAATDNRIHAVTAAMAGPTGLLPFAAAYPDRFHDVGIAEQHAATSAAGMAMLGLRPVVAVYSTFFARAFDQVLYDVALHQLPVVFVLDRAGITGPDGPSHHGVFDLALGLRVPGMTVFAPSCVEELRLMLDEALHLEGPAVIRYPKGKALSSRNVGSGLHAHQLVNAPRATIAVLAVGRMRQPALDAVALAETHGIAVDLWDVRVVKPLDTQMLDALQRYDTVVVVEDGVEFGGVGDLVRHELSERGAQARIHSLGTPDRFLPHATAESLLATHRLDTQGIAGVLLAVGTTKTSDTSRRSFIDLTAHSADSPRKKFAP